MEGYYRYIVAGGLILFALSIIPDIIDIILERFSPRNISDNDGDWKLF
jgi:hypothetical protein